MWLATKMCVRSVQPFWRFLNTDRKTNKPNLFIDIVICQVQLQSRQNISLKSPPSQPFISSKYMNPTRQYVNPPVQYNATSPPYQAPSPPYPSSVQYSAHSPVQFPTPSPSPPSSSTSPEGPESAPINHICPDCTSGYVLNYSRYVHTLAYKCFVYGRVWLSVDKSK